MLLSSGVTRRAVLGLAFAAGLLLAACSSVTPLYRSATVGPLTTGYRYFTPTSRLEQILLRELTLKLGPAATEGPRVEVSLAERTADLTSDELTSVPRDANQVTVTARIAVYDADGKQVFAGTRSQSADYTTGASVLPNNEARRSAGEKAVRLLADSVRLTVLGALGR